MTKPIRVEHLKPCVDWWGGAKRKGRKETEVAWKVTADEVKARGYNLDFKNPHTVADDHGDPEELLAKLDEAEKQTASSARPAQGDPGRGAAAMNPAQLLAHFDRISDAPDAIPRLRRFILDLAVRGSWSSKTRTTNRRRNCSSGFRRRRRRIGGRPKIKARCDSTEVEPMKLAFELPASLGVGAAWHNRPSCHGADALRANLQSRLAKVSRCINGPTEFSEGPFGKTVVNQYTTAPTNLLREGDILISVRGSTMGRTNVAGFEMLALVAALQRCRPFIADEYDSCILYLVVCAKSIMRHGEAALRIQRISRQSNRRSLSRSPSAPRRTTPHRRQSG